MSERVRRGFAIERMITLCLLIGFGAFLGVVTAVHGIWVLAAVGGSIALVGGIGMVFELRRLSRGHKSIDRHPKGVSARKQVLGLGGVAAICIGAAVLGAVANSRAVLVSGGIGALCFPVVLMIELRSRK